MKEASINNQYSFRRALPEKVANFLVTQPIIKSFSDLLGLCRSKFLAKIDTTIFAITYGDCDRLISQSNKIDIKELFKREEPFVLELGRLSTYFDKQLGTL